MTPAERARQIEKQEFEAECPAIRRRAYEQLGMHYTDERVKEWLAKPYVPGKPARPFRPVVKQVENSEPKPKRRRSGKFRTVGGMTMTLPQWAERLGVTLNALHTRIHRNCSLEAVVVRYLNEGSDQ